MPQYRQLWSVQVNEEAIRQPAAVIRLNGPGMPEIEVRQLRWSPRAGYIEMYNKDDPDHPITIPDPNARPEDFSWRWYGKSGYTTVSLTIERGVLAGRIWLRDKRFALRPSSAGLLLGETYSNHWQMHPDPMELQSRFAVGDAGLNVSRPPSDEVDGAWDYSCSGALPDGHYVVDLLVLYTPGVLLEYGSISAVEGQIRAGVDDANDALRNSGVHSFSYYLAGVELLPDSSSLDLAPVFEAHAFISGYTPTAWSPYCERKPNTYVVGRRDEMKADIVALARRDSGSQPICGYSFIQRRVPGLEECGYEPGLSFRELAYMIFDPECNGDRLNFAHELGHQLGADHDPRNYTPFPFGGASSCPWSHGHRSSDATLGFRTVMAYPIEGNIAFGGPACDDDADCPIIDAFSNPEYEWTGIAIQPVPPPPDPPQGLAIGVGLPPPVPNWQPARVADTLQRLAPVTASFRERPDQMFNSGFE